MKRLAALVLFAFLCTPLFGGDYQGISLSELAAAVGAGEFTPDYDSGKYTAVASGVEIVCAPGMATVLVGNESVALPGLVRFENQSVVLPLETPELVKAVLEGKREEPEVPDIDFTIVLDPGHIGYNKGGGGYGLFECHITLELAETVAAILKKRGFKVRLTRTSQEHLGMTQSDDLNSRPAIANRLGADLFVSIHANEFRDPGVQGFEVYYAPLKPGDRDELVRRMAANPLPKSICKGESPSNASEKKNLCRKALARKTALSRKLASSICEAFEKHVNDVNRGVKTAQFRVTRFTCCPSALVEIGFLSHRSTCDKLKKKSYRDRIARVIALGIVNYWKENGGD